MTSCRTRLLVLLVTVPLLLLAGLWQARDTFASQILPQFRIKSYDGPFAFLRDPPFAFALQVSSSLLDKCFESAANLIMCLTAVIGMSSCNCLRQSANVPSAIVRRPPCLKTFQSNTNPLSL